MNEQEFIKDFEAVNAWVNTMRPHWAHLNGDVHNDKEFWHQCIHTVKPDTFIAWCKIYNTLSTSQAQYFRKHSHIYEDTITIAGRIDDGKALTKPYDKTGYNKPVFRAAMAIKDIIAEVTERPFATKVEPPKPKKPTKQEVLEQWTKTKGMIDSLFDTGE
jgi:hypothetical protein